MTTCSTIQKCATDSPLCCHKPTQAHLFNAVRMEKAFRIVEKITVIALGVLAAFVAPELFIPAFAIGALIGAFISQPSSLHHHHHPINGGCSHGFIEERLGVKLPDSLSLLAGAAVMAVHIDHHADVFVPIVGLTLGIWAGNLTASSFNSCRRNIEVFATSILT